MGIAAANTVLNNRYRLHFERLSEHLTAYTELREKTVLQAIGLNNREAHTLAFADSFLALGALFVTALPLLPLSPAVPPAALQPDAH